MRFNIFCVIIALFFGAIACSVVETDRTVSVNHTDSNMMPGMMVFRADSFNIVDADIDTKTYVQPVGDYTGYNFFWSEKDTVGVFPSSGCQIPFELTSGADASYAVFSAGAWTCKPGFSYRSYFPFIDNYHLDPTEIQVSFLGQKQVGNDNSNHFRNYDYMYTTSTESVDDSFSFSFQHLICGILVWAEVPAGHYTGITLTVDEPIFVVKGEYDLTATNPMIVGKEYSNSLHIDLDISFANKDILKAYLLNSPIDLSGKTVTISITNDTGFTYFYTYSPSKSFSAANIYRMKSLYSLEGYASNNIRFADDNIKEKLVTLFDSNGDGELSYEEAAAVTSLSGVFGNAKNFKSFNEFQFFTNVTTLSDNQFQDWAALKTIILPSSIKDIGGMGPFDGCVSLKSITIPEGVTNLPYRAFYGCSSLSSVLLPDSLISIEQDAFCGCISINAIHLPESVKQIGVSAFSLCSNLVKIVIPKHIEVLNTRVFSYCTSLSKITLPEGLTNIGSFAFENCTSLVSLILPNSIRKIDNQAFQNSGLESISLPIGMTNIDASAFFLCINLKSVTLPNSLLTIGGGAFYGCNNLSTIIIPEEVVSIGVDAFKDCYGLNSIIVLPTDVPIGGNNMFQYTSDCHIYVPANSAEAYKAATNWSNYADRIHPIPDAVELGLSVKWASWNLGADAPEEYGDYFAWGELKPKSDYVWSNYKWCNGTVYTLTKYNTQAYYGNVDNKTVLEIEDDVAHVTLGGKCRMPTYEEWTELKNNCTSIWTEQNGVSGRLFISNINGNSIFLPAAGDWCVSNLDAGVLGFYWSSSLSPDSVDGPNNAHSFAFGPGNDEVYWVDDCRIFGLPIRPIKE